MHSAATTRPPIHCACEQPRGATAAPREERAQGTRSVVVEAAIVVGVVTLAAAGLGAALLPPLLGVPGASAALVLFVAIAAAMLAMAASLLLLVRRRLLVPLGVLGRAMERIGGQAEAAVSLPASADPALAAVGAGLDRVLRELAEDRRRLRDVAARAFRAQESERMRIAHELQEETAQQLTVLLLSLHLARTTADEALRARLLEEVRTTLIEATDTVRRFARGLHPPALNDVGVVAALESYAASLAETSGMRIVVEAEDVRGLLTRERELALFRIVQEALANTVRHSGAGQVRVGVHRSGAVLTATVHDDGRGFHPAEREGEHPCLGLFGMRERALYAGGRSWIESAPGVGTTVTVELPAVPAVPSDRADWPPIVWGAGPVAGGARTAPRVASSAAETVGV